MYFWREIRISWKFYQSRGNIYRSIIAICSITPFSIFLSRRYLLSLPRFSLSLFLLYENVYTFFGWLHFWLLWIFIKMHWNRIIKNKLKNNIQNFEKFRNLKIHLPRMFFLKFLKNFQINNFLIKRYFQYFQRE